MIRTHIGTPGPITVEPRQQVPEPTMKPKGLWYEVDGDWRRWCEAEEFGNWQTATVHRVELGSENMLLIRTLEELDEFNHEWVVTERVDDSLGKPFDYSLGIRWADVAERWDGIEIAPYIWTRRLEYMWYYGWDCASGVIWRPRGVRLTPES